jgi:hypothetical protein
MIELDGQMYPSEVRQSQPVQLETQETPAGSSDFPGLSEELNLGREVIEGSVIETGDTPVDIDQYRVGVAQPVYGANPVGVMPRASAPNEGEDYDGTLGDPAGGGAPMPRATNGGAPKLEADDLPWQPGEAEAAREMLQEMRELSDQARVLRFVRYPDDKRIMLVFTDTEESQSMQRQY